MQNTSFMESFKRLEQRCNEMYDTSSGVKAYIWEMESIAYGSRYVSGWNDDLKRLKHYNWVRNQITHEPGHNEDNMCESGDAQWLDNFHSRIMTQTDPLASYRKATMTAKKKTRAAITHVSLPQSKPLTNEPLPKGAVPQPVSKNNSTDVNFHKRRTFVDFIANFLFICAVLLLIASAVLIGKHII